jgi:hypothetical protein
MMSNNTFPVKNMCSDLKHLNPRKVSIMIRRNVGFIAVMFNDQFSELIIGKYVKVMLDMFRHS